MIPSLDLYLRYNNHLNAHFMVYNKIQQKTSTHTLKHKPKKENNKQMRSDNKKSVKCLLCLLDSVVIDISVLNYVQLLYYTFDIYKLLWDLSKFEVVEKTLNLQHNMLVNGWQLFLPLLYGNFFLCKLLRRKFKRDFLLLIKQ